jgi:hypothetical protein
MQVMSEPSLIPLVIEIYDVIFPFTFCPQPLFISIIAITELRVKATESITIDEAIRSLAVDMLAEIESFSPYEWAQSRETYQDDWERIAIANQSATALYCILAMQSLSVLVPNPGLDVSRDYHSDRLFSTLTKCSIEPYRQFLSWPLAVCGVDAAVRRTYVKVWIEKTFQDTKREVGCSISSGTGRFLRQFWKSGLTHWDGCWNKPCAVFM